ncbi:MAG TPA: aminotransferase class I/II-fold pyridoxal phosphate-dependent enzyme [Gemmatimonadaceae bacterium]|nr:aminotransferase class I/II-fold pyridoxal phosphate-dependent enzyme [Gemmatimonadaceae bacterium]
MPDYTDRLLSLPEYPLAGIPEKKRDLIARGVDVIDLGAGDADLSPPPAVIERISAAVRIPTMSRYGFALGLVEYREAVARFMKRRFNQEFHPLKEIIPLIGSKEGLSHLALAYAAKGDYTIFPEPGYNSYVGGTLLAEATPYKYALRPDNGFLIDLDKVPADVLKKAKILYLNYPNNPTAAIAPKEYLEDMVRRCKELDILLVYDNAYSELAYDGYVPPSIFEIEGARDVAIEFHSMSKTYNMTGWRCGWACGKQEFVSGLAKVKSFVDTGTFMAIQAAAATALDECADWIPTNVAEFKRRRDAAADAFTEAGFPVARPKATMYIWCPLPKNIPSAVFGERLLQDEGVVVLPGSAFGPGGEGFFRVSFITSPDRLREAATRAGRVLKRLQAQAGVESRSPARQEERQGMARA